MATEKLDLSKLYKEEYAAAKKPKLVQTQPGLYLAFDGRGEPGGELFTQHVEALYTLGYTIKFARKATGSDFKVSTLEGLWWGWEPDQETRDMSWKLLIRMPDFVTQADLEAAVATALGKGKTEMVEQVLLETIDEGPCVQMLHVGPYEDEPATIAAMMAFAEMEGKQVSGHHHEIYLSDPHQVPKERWRTILRYPVKDKS